ncbi:MAG: hypothetical protein WCW03_00765 [Candidatus Paceibacterota bacterium]|jgi:hypothetical protein
MSEFNEKAPIEAVNPDVKPKHEADNKILELSEEQMDMIVRTIIDRLTEKKGLPNRQNVSPRPPMVSPETPKGVPTEEKRPELSKDEVWSREVDKFVLRALDRVIDNADATKRLDDKLREEYKNTAKYREGLK